MEEDCAAQIPYYDLADGDPQAEELEPLTIRECRWAGCGALLPESLSLQEHLETHLIDSTSEEGCKWADCPKAGLAFTAKYKLLVHMRIHTQERLHQCSVCHKSFSRTENLRIHTRCHTGERPYVCPVEGCTKAYANSSDRHKHIKTHFADRPYVCRSPGCAKRYTDPSSLRKHIKNQGHLRSTWLSPEEFRLASIPGDDGAFPAQLLKREVEGQDEDKSTTTGIVYTCPVEGCSQSFPSHAERTRHVKSHYCARRYRCFAPECTKSYTDPSSLRKHIKTQGHYRHLWVNHDSSDSQQASDSMAASCELYELPANCIKVELNCPDDEECQEPFYHSYNNGLNSSQLYAYPPYLCYPYPPLPVNCCLIRCPNCSFRLQHVEQHAAGTQTDSMQEGIRRFSPDEH